MPAKHGFTLLEISIVMLIISLIAGGVLVGQNLIRNAEIQGINGEVQRYLTAIKTFQDKYQALPGDFSSASNLFSGAPDGNGNGLILGNEQYAAWHHLASAKLIEGTYTGLPVTVGSWPLSVLIGGVPGTNIPTSQVSKAGWGLVYIYHATSNAIYPYVPGDIPHAHMLWLGGTSANPVDGVPQAPVLFSEEADLIDQKFDDGLPSVGKIVAQRNPSGTQCYSSDTSYNLASTADKICALAFKTGF